MYDSAADDDSDGDDDYLGTAQQRLLRHPGDATTDDADEHGDSGGSSGAASAVPRGLARVFAMWRAPTTSHGAHGAAPTARATSPTAHREAAAVARRRRHKGWRWRLALGVFVVLNVLVFLLAAAAVGLAVFLVAAGYTELLLPGSSFAAGLVTLGALVALLCVVGCVFSLFEYRPGLVAYFSATLLLVLLELGFVVVAAVRYPAVAATLDDQWALAPDETRNKVQLQLGCCGFANRTDSPGSNCRPEWTVACAVVVQEYVHDRRVIVIGVGVAVLAVQMACLTLSCYLFLRIPTAKQLVAQIVTDEWRRTLGGTDSDDEGIPAGVF